MRGFNYLALIALVVALVAEVLVAKDPSQSLFNGLNKKQAAREPEMVSAGIGKAAESANAARSGDMTAFRQKRDQIVVKYNNLVKGKVPLNILSISLAGFGVLMWAAAILRKEDRKFTVPNILLVVGFVLFRFFIVL